MIEVYTDGSASWRTEEKLGGVGVVILEGDKQNAVIYSEGYKNTTNSRMELRALLIALQILEDKCEEEITIHIDSQYVVKSFTLGWVETWRREGYFLRPNKDLIEQIYLLKQKFKNLTLKWVRGHDGNEFNELADNLANYKQFKNYILCR